MKCLLLWLLGMVALTAQSANLAAQTAAAATQNPASIGPRYDVTQFGAVGNNASTTGSISSTSNSTTLTVASASTFVQGQGIYVAGAGASGAPLVTTISYISGLTFTLAAPALTTVTSAAVIADDTAAIQTAFNACWNFGQPPVDGVVEFPGTRTYLISSTINAYSGCKIEGNEEVREWRYWPRSPLNTITGAEAAGCNTYGVKLCCRLESLSYPLLHGQFPVLSISPREC